ncbi:sensor histidine kinase [Metabacillus malikii]|uniref:Sensor histidine kinase YesM n=1 Tax=Metabacillus malikii TaxID=1504265 RepID=A0ABT9ZN02_9BACI|nr:histidine kinase [Metabacillus malikii]MDQ0233627.1 sensor histidine kinase YesM [Metabacillus malikii]
MSIRVKLFIFIPILVILLNIVAFVIFQSGKLVQDSYHIMMERVLLYKQISTETKDNLLVLNSYIINQDDHSYKQYYLHKEKLEKLRAKLEKEKTTNIGDIQIENYDQMIQSFLDSEMAVVSYLKLDDFDSYLLRYEEAEKIAGFIQEEGQNMVDRELSYYQPIYHDIINYSRQINQLGIALFLTTTLLSVVIAIWMSRSISIPINRLVEKAQQISKGNLNIETEDVAKANDEIGILGKAFHQMLKDLKHYISQHFQVLESKRLVKELELKALQSQINPHFLFNTLNVISKLAYIEGAEKTSDLTVTASNLIRYNLRKLDQPVTLRDELHHIKEYLTIQKARFQERVHFEYDIDESVLNQIIPCLTLQPILENAFVHGIENMESDGEINIVMKDEQAYVYIKLSDNGNGMDETIKQKLLNYMSEGENGYSTRKSTGLGTINVFKRLYLFYGEEMKIEIDSNKGVGTSIIFMLPKLS